MNEPRPLLTPLEVEVLQFAFMGRTTADIAQVMGVSPFTIKSHLNHLCIKLNAFNRQNAIYKALQYDLIELPPLLVVTEHRVRAIVEAAPTAVSEVVTWRDLRFDIARHLLYRSHGGDAGVPDTWVKLWSTDQRLLMYLLETPNRVHSRSHLLDVVWGTTAMIEERTVDVHIRRVREALEKIAPDYRAMLCTIRGTGYIFAASPEAQALAAEAAA